MLDSVSLRMRLELASNEFVVNTHLKDKGYKYSISSAKLFCDRVIPYPSALESLNKSLMNEAIDYAYNKTIYKSYVLGANQTSILMDLPWAQIIPEMLYMVILIWTHFRGSMS